MAMTKRIIVALTTLLQVCAYGQESNSIFNFLELPASSHGTALGGNAISLIEDDASLIFYNPALLSSVSDRTLHFSYMTYMQGCHVASAAFTKITGERSTMGITAHYAHYGTMTEITADQTELGSFTSMDMAISGMYAYNLSDRWAGGVTAKFIYGRYADYSSVALAADLGLNYFNEETAFSLSAVAKNLGGQVKAFGNTHEKLPFSLQIGISKDFAHAPFRLSVTMSDLTEWGDSYLYINSEEKESTAKQFLSHVSLGIDYLPSNRFYLALGYNFRKAYEMKAYGSSHAAGLCAGAGLHLTRFSFGVAYAQYHLSAPSLVFNAAFKL